MTTKQYEQFKAAIEHNLKGLSHVSTGACKGCAECGLEAKECRKCDGDGKDWQHGHPDSPCPTCNGEGEIEPTDRECDSASEGSFSWSSCDACGSTLGGNREPAHGVMADGGILHLDICTDCLYFLNYGQLDDLTMMEMEKEEA